LSSPFRSKSERQSSLSPRAALLYRMESLFAEQAFGTKSTMSNVVDQVKMLDSRGHETNRSGERQNDRRGFCPSPQGCRGTLARCRYDKLRNRSRTCSNCCTGHLGSEEIEPQKAVTCGYVDAPATNWRVWNRAKRNARGHPKQRRPGARR
jgi:hypothetical protein